MSSEDLGNTLYVSTSGSHLTLEGDAVRCYLADTDTWRRLPLARVESIVLIGAVTATSDLLVRCADDGRQVHWLTEFGRPRASLVSPARLTGSLRSAQHRIHADEQARARLAATLVLGKIDAMNAQLRRAAHDATGHNKQALRRAIDTLTALSSAPPPDCSRQQALGFEGAATRAYYTGLRHWLHPADGLDIPEARTRHPATDPVNATLSFAYALTRGAVHGAVHAVGLDPAIGFLHGDREGQPALVLDLMEELRPSADRVVVTLFNRKQLRAEHFETAISGAVQLTDEGRKTLFTAWHQHRRTLHLHKTLGREVPVGLVPHVQARVLVRHLTGDIPAYLPVRE